VSWIKLILPPHITFFYLVFLVESEMMASFYSDGSPTGKRKASASFAVHEDQENEIQGDGVVDCGVVNSSKSTDGYSYLLTEMHITDGLTVP
jgi:hypothetical protein